MIVLAAALAALAVGLWWSPGTSSSWARLRPPRARRRRRLLSVLTGLLVILVTVMAAGSVAGPAAAVLALAAAAVAATATLLLRRHRREVRSERHRVEVAQACAGVAAQVRIGRIPAEALVVTARDRPVLRLTARQIELGAEVVDCLQLAAREPGSGGLRHLAHAWSFAQRTGAPLAGVLDRISASLREDQATRQTVTAELAAPRASGAVMAALPIAGIGLGYLIGGDPVSFLLDGPVGWSCLLGGTGLALVGVIWLDWLARISEPQLDDP